MLSLIRLVALVVLPALRAPGTAWADNQPKPARNIFYMDPAWPPAVLTQVLGPSPECVGAKAIGKAGHVAGFETGRQAVLVLWQSEDERAPDLSLPSGKDFTWMEAMGRKVAGPPAKLSSSLTYLLGRSGRAVELLRKIAR